MTTTSKGNKNNKGHKTTGGKYVGAKYITVKKGMTYWDLAKKYGTTVAQLRKWNGNEKTTMYPDKTGKYPKKLRVTAGVAIKQATEVGTGKIVYTNLKKNVNAPYSIVDKIHRQLMSGEAIMNTDK
ncbi:LysM peptidoglycan-binding domain-containing protein [Secundilactobacillus similis]|uniref:LysM peptidoglycan-binding domain-containing protein n=1 Tax=Secundilactobacillus similis TaxID=414682 RepID=UPI0006D172C6|nr:LysM domain-containing protein [Secundilactobacillus similis]